MRIDYQQLLDGPPFSLSYVLQSALCDTRKQRLAGQELHADTVLGQGQTSMDVCCHGSPLPRLPSRACRTTPSLL